VTHRVAGDVKLLTMMNIEILASVELTPCRITDRQQFVKGTGASIFWIGKRV
jgi:hypothetical protein